MAIIGGLFGLLGRFAGRLLNSALGWATVLLFGKVSGRNQFILLGIAFASLLWVVTLAGIALPQVGLFVLALAPIPSGVDPSLVRLAMLALAIVVPLAVGLAAAYVAEPARRARRPGLAVAILRGYPFTLVLALTIAVLAAVSLVRKARSLARRWEDAHIPVIVKPGGYDQVLDDIERVLDLAGLAVTRRPASVILSLPPRLLDAVAGKALGGLVPDRLMLLAGQELEVLVYPSDLAISGTKPATARARAAIAAQLTRSPAYLTTSAEAQRVEEALRTIAGARQVSVASLARVRELDLEIARLVVPFDEWQTVYRERLQVERDLLAEPRSAAVRAVPSTAPGPALGEFLVGATGFVLLGLDVALLLRSRLDDAADAVGRSERRTSVWSRVRAIIRRLRPRAA
jgi:hypothetical protein